MSTRNGTWVNCKRLLVRDFQQDGWNVLSGLLFVLVFAVFGSPFLLETRDNNFHAVAKDLYFLGIVGSLGFSLMSREYRISWWKKTPITKRLMFLKSMPISAKEIIWSRVLYFLSTYVFYNIFFFSLLSYVWLREGNLLSEFIIIALVWMSYGLAAGFFYLWLELTQREKVYFLSSLVLIAVLLVLLILLRWMGVSIFGLIEEGARTYGFALPLCTLLIAVIIGLMFMNAIIKGFNKRELV